MKIMKAVDKKVGETTYYKYKINLPKKIEETDLLNKELKISYTVVLCICASRATFDAVPLPNARMAR